MMRPSSQTVVERISTQPTRFSKINVAVWASNREEGRGGREGREGGREGEEGRGGEGERVQVGKEIECGRSLGGTYRDCWLSGW